MRLAYTLIFAKFSVFLSEQQPCQEKPFSSKFYMAALQTCSFAFHQIQSSLNSITQLLQAFNIHFMLDLAFGAKNMNFTLNYNCFPRFWNKVQSKVLSTESLISFSWMVYTQESDSQLSAIFQECHWQIRKCLGKQKDFRNDWSLLGKEAGLSVWRTKDY